MQIHDPMRGTLIQTPRASKGLQDFSPLGAPNLLPVLFWKPRMHPPHLHALTFKPLFWCSLMPFSVTPQSCEEVILPSLSKSKVPLASLSMSIFPPVCAKISCCPAVGHACCGHGNTAEPYVDILLLGDRTNFCIVNCPGAGTHSLLICIPLGTELYLTMLLSCPVSLGSSSHPQAFRNTAMLRGWTKEWGSLGASSEKTKEPGQTNLGLCPIRSP